MKVSNGGGAALAIKAAVCLVFAVIAVFFVIQASLGARGGGGDQPREDDISLGLGQTVYNSLKGLLDDLASSRVLALAPAWELAVNGEAFLEEQGGVLYLTSNVGQVMAVDAASGEILWSLDLGAWVSAPPAVQAGVVYVGATDHVLYALDAGSGTLLWYYTSRGRYWPSR